MNRHILLRAMAVIVLQLAGMAAAETPNRITILYDSFGKFLPLTMDWGFAALVEYRGKRILFDTGNNARIFEHNVKATGSRPAATSILWSSRTATPITPAASPTC